MWQDHVKMTLLILWWVLLSYYITMDACSVFASVRMVFNVPAEVMLSPVVILTRGHVVVLFGIGLKLQHKWAPSKPSRLHPSPRWAVRQTENSVMARTHTAAYLQHIVRIKLLKHFTNIIHNWLLQCNKYNTLPTNRAYKQHTSGTQPHPAHPAAHTHPTRQVKCQQTLWSKYLTSWNHNNIYIRDYSI